MIGPRLPVPLPWISVGLITLAFAAACTAFVWQSRLASFADDSMSYLVMAQVFSPYRPAGEFVAEAFAREAIYPPLFPLLLGFAGASHNIALAHAVTALLLAACLPALYALGVRWLGAQWAATAAVAAAALMPSLWINAKGILSEPLFLLLLLATLLVLDAGAKGRAGMLMLALLMAALVLTRAAGLVMVAAYAFWGLARREEPLRGRALETLPALAAAAAYGLWLLLRIAVESANSYFSPGSGLTALGGRLATQADAMVDAWIGALVLFWVEGRPIPVVLAGAVGLAALAGLALRFRDGKADGWMTAAYLGTLLLWPFTGQMDRFMFPVVPVLLLYACYTLGEAMRMVRRPASLGVGVLALTLLSLAAPGLGFIHERVRVGAEGGFGEMTEWYRTPDLDQARARAEVHLGLLADMMAIRETTGPKDRIMWVAPGYVALLAGRYGYPAPPAGLSPVDYRTRVAEARADYVFLSVYHPRNTISDAAWTTGTAALIGHAGIAYARNRRDGSLDAVLLRPRPIHAPLFEPQRLNRI